ncbi:MAG: RluA family pseudouridine synthase [Clostridiaceae bacterium]|nr:RluA family pseudouridine synthase [Clostridiaceae bacterium]
MKSFKIPADMAGKKVIRACISVYPTLTPARMHKALRHKDIRVNGKRITSDVVIGEGDVVELWVPDSFFDASQTLPDGRMLDDYKVVFENDDLLMINKRQGLAVHPGKGTAGDTLIDLIRKDFRNPAIDLCHRIDMNTGGIVMLAKNKASLEHAVALFKHNHMTKRYRCLVLGTPDAGTSCICDDDTLMMEIKGFLEKPTRGNVFIHDVPSDNDLPITTRYRVLTTYRGIGPDGEDVSELEVELVTGRTHQIRAHMAHIGHPIIGDGNYGRNRINRHFESPLGGKVRYQQLFASSLFFAGIPRDNMHFRLSGRKFSVEPLYGVKLED